ncbi:MAG: TlpA family protein disulfide reductase [Planctomycetes bacterium]|nr:TlpA family protein disulfide reductase [Planctomycetota bacterium]
MYPHERSLVQRLASAPFALVGMNSDKSPEVFAAAAAREQLTWPCFFDGGGTDGPIATRWGVRGWPTIFVLDADGVIRYRDVRDEELARAVDALLAEMPAKEGRK